MYLYKPFLLQTATNVLNIFNEPPHQITDKRSLECHATIFTSLDHMPMRQNWITGGADLFAYGVLGRPYGSRVATLWEFESSERNHSRNFRPRRPAKFGEFSAIVCTVWYQNRTQLCIAATRASSDRKVRECDQDSKSFLVVGLGLQFMESEPSN